MAVLRKRKLKKGWTWMVDYYDHGKRVRLNTGSQDKAVAAVALDGIRGRLALNKFGMPGVREGVLLGDFAERYLEESRVNKAANTWRLERRVLSAFLGWMGSVLVSDVRLSDGERYVAQLLEVNNKVSVNIKIRILKTFFSSAVHRDVISENPFGELKQFRVRGPSIPPYLSEDQVRRLLEVIVDVRHRVLAMVYLYTGCRRNEALGLRWQDVDFRNRRIFFHVTKGGGSRVVPISSKLFGELRGLRGDAGGDELIFRYRPDYVTRRFRKYLWLVGFTGRKSVHVFRHTFVSHLISKVGIFETQRLAGHSDVSMTLIYAHLAKDRLRESIEELPY